MRDAHWVWSLTHAELGNEMIDCLNLMRRIAEINASWPKNEPYDIHKDVHVTKKNIGEIQRLVRLALGEEE